VVAGPAFLQALHQHTKLPTLQNILVGGASLDCSTLETFIKHWHDTDFTHVYGSSEAEPVAHIDARRALELSKNRGLFQVLCLGNPVSSIRSQIENDDLWIAGDHVCGPYLGDATENVQNKKTAPDGTLWHRMGDRVVEQDGLWWYAGRSHQSIDLFQLEQRVYSFASSSNAFIHKTPNNQLVLVCSGLSRRLRRSLQTRFPEISEVREVKQIVRDRRHRARIDQGQTLKRYASDLLP
jgi:hypothetical protein